jgi:hypothetical protein
MDMRMRSIQNGGGPHPKNPILQLWKEAVVNTMWKKQYKYHVIPVISIAKISAIYGV